MQSKHIIEPSEIQTLARPCYADSGIAVISIEEAEQLDIKPRIGDALFLRITSKNEDFETLMQGGVYETCGKSKVFQGLKKTTAYYAYARIVKNGSGIQTRFGYSQKKDEYSGLAEFKERNQTYNDAFSIADAYLMECLSYIEANTHLFPDYTGKGRVKSNRTVFKAIGD